MFVNNEIGVIQDMKNIGKICREKKVFFHTDGAQALGKIPINVNDLNIDLMSMSGHKVYYSLLYFLSVLFYRFMVQKELEVCM